MERRPEPELPEFTDVERRRQGLLLTLLTIAIGYLMGRWLISDVPADDRDIAWAAFMVAAVVCGVPIAVLAFVRRHRPPTSREEIATARAKIKPMLPGIGGVVSPIAVWWPDAIGWAVSGVITGFGAGGFVGGGLGLLVAWAERQRRARRELP